MLDVSDKTRWRAVDARHTDLCALRRVWRAASVRARHCEKIVDRSRRYDFRISAHRHDRLYQMLFIFEGGGEVAFDGSKAELEPPCIVLIPAGVVHEYTFSEIVDGLVITLYQTEFERLLQADPVVVQALSAPMVLCLAAAPEAAATISASLRTLAREVACDDPGRHSAMGASLVTAWVAACRVLGNAAPSGAPTRFAVQAARFREMVERDFRACRSIEAYAAPLGITTVHLRRLCRAEFGTSPTGVLDARAVLEAKRLLVFSAAGVKQVAAAAGFDDHAYFSRFFVTVAS